MKIIVVGCGKIGTAIVASLIAEGHDVVAVDTDADVISQITNIYDAMAVCGSGTDCDTLTEAGVKNTRLFVAVTGSDELNMLSCFLARRMGARHTVARIRNPEYSDTSLSFMRQQLGLSMIINPELHTAQAIYHVLKLPSAAKIETFSRRNFEMVELKLKAESPLNGVKLMDLRQKYHVRLLVCAVQRGEEVYIPDGNFVLQCGDKIGIATTPTEIIRFLKLTNMSQKQARHIMILGASRTAHYLANLLLNSGSSVKVVEIDRARCEEFCDSVPDAVVIHGDGAQQELLKEEGIGSMDAFVALTGMDEENILLSYFAASQHVPKVISKVNRSEFYSTAEHLGIDCLITPKKIVVDIILRYARALQNSMGSKIETLYKLMDDKAEAIEFIAQPDCKLLKIPLKDMRLKPNTLLAGIVRGRKTIVPTGDDMVLAGDRVVVLCKERLNDLSDIIE